MYDVVWYTPERLSDVDKVLRRLELEEVIERGCPDVRLSSRGVPIPGQDCIGRAVTRNFRGAEEAVDLGSPELTGLCYLEPQGDGLVGGIFRPSFWLSHELDAAEKVQDKREEFLKPTRDPSVKELLRSSYLSFLTAILSFVAAIVSIPKIFKAKPKPKTIRQVQVLDAEADKMIAYIKNGI